MLEVAAVPAMSLIPTILLVPLLSCSCLVATGGDEEESTSFLDRRCGAHGAAVCAGGRDCEWAAGRGVDGDGEQRHAVAPLCGADHQLPGALRALPPGGHALPR